MIIVSTTRGILENLIGFGDRLEFLSSLRIVTVLVGVEFTGLCLVGLFEIPGADIWRYTEKVVELGVNDHRVKENGPASWRKAEE
jgi:hypothetical protein